MPSSGARVLMGRYRLVRRLGRGGMGTVWQAHDEVLGRDVAVKEILLPPGLNEAELAAVRGRALREARAAAQVRHPAIVTIHDVVIQDGHPWIVMDLVRAPSLSDRLAESGRLSIAESARVGAVLADALDAVHRHGIVHRDVKPANVLLADDGEVVLTDFGIAVIEGDARFTRTGLLIGTPGFIAPECLEGKSAGPASDVWSLGAVLFKAVEGRPAYEGSSPAVIDAAVLNGRPARQLRSGPLATLISTLLARDPADRPDARTAATRLAQLTRSPRGEVRGTATDDEPERPQSRTRPAPIVAAAPKPAPSPAGAAGKASARPRHINWSSREMEPWQFFPPNNRVRIAATRVMVFGPIILVFLLIIIAGIAEIFRA